MGTPIISGGTPVISGGTPVVSGGTPIVTGGTPVIGGGGGTVIPGYWQLIDDVLTSYPNHTSAPIDTTGATLLVIATTRSTTAPVITDSYTNAWTPAVSNTQSPTATDMYYSINPVVGPGHTFTMSGASLFSFVAIALTARWGYPIQLDQTAIGNQASGTTLQLSPITPTADQSILLTSIALSTGAIAGIDTGFTIEVNVPEVNGETYGLGAAYLLENATVTVAPTWTLTQAAAAAAVMASFKQALPWTLLAQVDTSTPTTTSAPIDTTGANLLIIVVTNYTAAPVLSDSNNNQWFWAATGQGTINNYIFYCINPIVGPGHTFTNPINTNAAYSFAVLAYAGPSVIGLDNTRVAGTASGTSVQLPSSMSTANNSLIITVLGSNNATMNVDSSFIIFLTRTTAYTKAFASLLQPVPAPVAPTWTIPAPVYMAAALVSFKPVPTSAIWTLLRQTFAANPTFTTPPVDTTGANLIVITASNASGALPVFSDSYGNTWVAGAQNGFTTYKRSYYCINPTVGPGHTFTNSAAPVASSFAVLAFRGPATITYNQNNSSVFPTGSYTSWQATPLTPTANNALIISSTVATTAGAQIQSIDSGFNIAVLQSGVGGGQYNDAVAYFVQATAAAVAPRWTLAAASLSGTVIMLSFIGS